MKNDNIKNNQRTAIVTGAPPAALAWALRGRFLNMAIESWPMRATSAKRIRPFQSAAIVRMCDNSSFFGRCGNIGNG